MEPIPITAGVEKLSADAGATTTAAPETTADASKSTAAVPKPTASETTGAAKTSAATETGAATTPGKAKATDDPEDAAASLQASVFGILCVVGGALALF